MGGANEVKNRLLQGLGIRPRHQKQHQKQPKTKAQQPKRSQTTTLQKKPTPIWSSFQQEKYGHLEFKSGQSIGLETVSNEILLRIAYFAAPEWPVPYPGEATPYDSRCIKGLLSLSRASKRLRPIALEALFSRLTLRYRSSATHSLTTYSIALLTKVTQHSILVNNVRRLELILPPGSFRRTEPADTLPDSLIKQHHRQIIALCVKLLKQVSQKLGCLVLSLGGNLAMKDLFEALVHECNLTFPVLSRLVARRAQLNILVPLCPNLRVLEEKASSHVESWTLHVFTDDAEKLERLTYQSDSVTGLRLSWPFDGDIFTSLIEKLPSIEVLAVGALINCRDHCPPLSQFIHELKRIPKLSALHIPACLPINPGAKGPNGKYGPRSYWNAEDPVWRASMVQAVVHCADVVFGTLPHLKILHLYWGAGQRYLVLTRDYMVDLLQLVDEDNRLQVHLCSYDELPRLEADGQNPGHSLA